MKKLFFLAFVLVLGKVEAGEVGEGLTLTIYSAPNGVILPFVDCSLGGSYFQIPAGFGIVTERRNVRLADGRNKINFEDVPILIDPTTVYLKSLTDPETILLEQSYEYDLLNYQNLLERCVGKEIFFERDDGKRKRGILLATRDLNGVNIDGEIYINPPGNIIVPENLLVTKPTLVGLINTKTPGEHLVEISYETKGIAWNADYNAIFKEGKLSLSGWATIDNKSGKNYENAKIRLVAGDVQRIKPAEPPLSAGGGAIMMENREISKIEPGFTERTSFEYHLYTLNYQSSISDNSKKQIELFPSIQNIPCKKSFFYFGNFGQYYSSWSPQLDPGFGITGNNKIDVYLSFKNTEDSNLGIPLPAGRFRVYQEDEEALTIIGEEMINHTPKDEEVMIKLGSAFDIVGERKQTDFRCERKLLSKWMEESFEITISNHKDEDIEVVVKENLLRWKKWKIIKTSHPYEKIAANTIYFTLKVPKDSEEKATYTVRYEWW
jgi:hypothetical protein